MRGSEISDISDISRGFVLLASALLTVVACGASGVVGGSTTSEAATSPIAATTLIEPSGSTTLPLPTTTEGPSVDVTVERGLVYREAVNSDGTTQTSKVDVFVPDLPGERPAVILLHGWGQPGGDEELTPLTSLADAIAQLGATVFYFNWHTNGGLSARSGDDLSCIGPFVAARAAGFGARPESILIVGHSMGGDAGANLAFRSFELPTKAVCVESGTAPPAKAFLGTGGSYGWNGLPVDSNPEAFLMRSGCSSDLQEVAASEAARPGLTGQESFDLGGYSSVHLAPDSLQTFLLVGTEDPNVCTSAHVTRDFAETLDLSGVEHELIEVEGAGHEDVVNPLSVPGKNTVEVIDRILNGLEN